MGSYFDFLVYLGSDDKEPFATIDGDYHVVASKGDVLVINGERYEITRCEVFCNEAPEDNKVYSHFINGKTYIVKKVGMNS